MKTSEYTETRAGNSRPYARPPGTAGSRRAYRCFTCEHCGRDFRAKPVHDRRGVRPRRFCSQRCAGADRTAAAKCGSAFTGAEDGSPSRDPDAFQHPKKLVDISLAKEMTPAQSAKLRCYVFGLLRKQVPLAHRVVMGEAHWSPTQARIFGQLLDKCIRDLPAAYVDHEHFGREDVSACSRRKLEALAADVANVTG